MSVEFFNMRKVVGRKSHICEQCRKNIQIGVEHHYCAMKCDGDFTSYREHVECRKAWLALIDLTDGGFHEDTYPFLCDEGTDAVEPEWFLNEHPIVAARLGIARVSA